MSGQKTSYSSVRPVRPDFHLISPFADLTKRPAYLLSIHSHAHGLIQQLTHTRLVPNSIHRDLATYWARHGQTKGEIYVRPSRSDGGGAYAAYAAYSSRRERVGGEWENRWRVELTHDGKAYGFQQDVGVVWSADLGSMG